MEEEFFSAKNISFLGDRTSLKNFSQNIRDNKSTSVYDDAKEDFKIKISGRDSLNDENSEYDQDDQKEDYTSNTMKFKRMDSRYSELEYKKEFEIAKKEDMTHYLNYYKFSVMMHLMIIILKLLLL